MKQDKIWNHFWKNRESSFIGNILLFIREKILSRSFVDIAIKNSKKGKILEAGCGTALSSILVGKKRGDKIYALDFLPEALKKAKEFSGKYQLKINLVKGDLFNMPFKNKEFDLCWNIGTIEHFKNPLLAIKEMKRVGKVVIVIIPAKGPVWKIYLRIINSIGPKVEGYAKLYDTKELKKLFKKANFEKTEVKVVRSLGFPYITAIGK